MDYIVNLIVTAIALGTAAGLKNVTENALSDSYNHLKQVISDRFGNKKNLLAAVKELNLHPEDRQIRSLVEKELLEAGAAKDLFVVEAANLVHLAIATHNSKTTIYRQRLRRKLKQAEAIENQIDLTIDDGQKVILQEKVEVIWKEIIELEKHFNLKNQLNPLENDKE